MYDGGYVHVLFKLFLFLAIPYVNPVGRAINKFNLIELDTGQSVSMHTTFHS